METIDIPEEITNYNERAYYVFKTILDVVILFIKEKIGETVNLDDATDAHIAAINEHIAQFNYTIAICKEHNTALFDAILDGKKSTILSKNKNLQLLPTDFFYIIRYPNYYYILLLGELRAPPNPPSVGQF
jgi:hypothetical protein